MVMEEPLRVSEDREKTEKATEVMRRQWGWEGTGMKSNKEPYTLIFPLESNKTYGT